ncbi:amidohydrolase family protein [Simiduia curdlanivorans]|uniref:Amidohydrolase n=1 Tax=Simiduia curdlanivorans TaxID=1492769 RepID=A0ABV8V4X5_9GAMM|nr:amidohydrolase family protein [Simiduia curdlanivorans]MDN3640926.1 amidohydrolase family protein [Simiduia curdlanivorans]
MPNNFKFLAIALVFFSTCLGATSNHHDLVADRIFSGGTILTVNDEQPLVQAVAIKEGKIIFAGDLVLARAYANDKTDWVDLAGNTLLPGFIDAHTHPILSALMGQTVDVSGFNHRNSDAVWRSLREGVASASAGDWVIAYGWDPAMLNDLAAPTMAQLDEIAPNNPLLIITQTLHTAFANSQAFALAGVTKNTPDPNGGAFEKDAEGELTGTVIEIPAIAYFKKVTPRYPRAAYQYLLENQIQAYARAGYTTIVAPGLQPLMPQTIEAIQFATDYIGAPVRLRTYPLAHTLDAANATSNDYGPHQGSERFAVLGVKLWIDGSPYAGGMAMAEPYLDTELSQKSLGIPTASRGHLTYSDAELNALVQHYHDAGWQISAHAQGERAVDQFLNAVALAAVKNPRIDHRHRMEHLALITQSQLARAKQLGVTTSFYIEHIRYYGEALRDFIIGPERSERFMPQAWALTAGHKVSFHTDSPSSPLNVFKAMQTSVTRTSQLSDVVIGADQQVSPEQVIRMLTLDAAWQIFEEDNLGSIAVGKKADFTLLNGNPLAQPVSEWTELSVVSTFIDGEPVQADGFTVRKLNLLAKAGWQVVFGE